jgi:peptide/nickel transport system substrate-binding protein
MMSVSRLRAGSLFALILAVFLFGNLPHAGAAEQGKGGALRLLFWQAPTVVNPHLSIGSKDLTASRVVYEPLATFDRDGRLIPFLAAEIPSLKNGGVAPDGRSVTWTLKQGTTCCSLSNMPPTPRSGRPRVRAIGRSSGLKSSTTTT